jgi:hypothetical protein
VHTSPARLAARASPIHAALDFLSRKLLSSNMSEFWRRHQRWRAKIKDWRASSHGILLDGHDKYLVQLRRELVRAQARLKRAELECDRLRAENERLKELIGTSKKKSDGGS